VAMLSSLLVRSDRILRIFPMDSVHIELQLPLLFQPSTNTFIICLVFGFHVFNNLLKLRFTPDGVEKGVIFFNIIYNGQGEYLTATKFSQDFISLILFACKCINTGKIIVSITSRLSGSTICSKSIFSGSSRGYRGIVF
jgi:hypothetical protein